MKPKLPKKIESQLVRAHADLCAARDYLMSPQIEVCRRPGDWTRDTFTRPNGETMSVVNKSVGSNLARLHTGIESLESLLQHGPVAPENRQAPSLDCTKTANLRSSDREGTKRKPVRECTARSGLSLKS